MAAIITTPFRVLNAENFKEDVGSSSVYLGTEAIVRYGTDSQKEKWLPKCWDYYHIDDECVVDFFIMYENLENDYQKFCDMVGVPYEVLNKEKFLRKDKKYHQYYDDTTKNIVSDNFINEINKFHYKF